jgi:hypothetical protein
MELLSLDHFAPHVNSTFSASYDGMEVPFELVEARALPQRAPEGMRAPFSLLFRNTAPIVFPQQMYPMRHDKLGELGIFIVPIAQERGGFLYQAIFN